MKRAGAAEQNCLRFQAIAGRHKTTFLKNADRAIEMREGLGHESFDGTALLQPRKHGCDRFRGKALALPRRQKAVTNLGLTPVYTWKTGAKGADEDTAAVLAKEKVAAPANRLLILGDKIEQVGEDVGFPIFLGPRGGDLGLEDSTKFGCHGGTKAYLAEEGFTGHGSKGEAFRIDFRELKCVDDR